MRLIYETWAIVVVVPVALLAIGVLLLLLSSNWVKLYPPASYWTDADTTKLDELNEHIHKLYYELSQDELAEVESPGRDPAAPRTPYEKAVEVRNTHRAQRDIAMTRPLEIAASLRWGGLGCLLVGALSFYALKQ